MTPDDVADYDQVKQEQKAVDQDDFSLICFHANQRLQKFTFLICHQADQIIQYLIYLNIHLIVVCLLH